ncbi:MAG: ABC transporter ATP-binding protein [Clostridia bacterium]
MRRSGLEIMAKLFLLVGKLIPVLVLAVIGGSLGFLCAISITVLGAVGIAKLLGFFTAISFNTIFILIISFGILRGVLRYFEQYSNHYIAFKLLATLRDKIFTKLRELCPAKLESKQKGQVISMITADIEILEVFYAHTMSPVCIAIFVSLLMFIFVGLISNWLLAFFVLFSYLVIGLIMPIFNSKFLSKSGVKYRDTFAKFSGFFMDMITGNKEIILHGKQEEKASEIGEFSEKLTQNAKELSHKTTQIEAVTSAVIVVLNLSMLGFSLVLLSQGIIDISSVIVATVTQMSSFGPVLALNALPNDLTKTFASGDRVLSLMEEKPEVYENKNGENINLNYTEIKNLDFSYAKGIKILNDVNLTVKTGEIVGIKGSSGGGKSTLLKLIMRFWDKTSGQINLENIEIENINSGSLKENVTLISQTTYLFAGTVKENLRIAKQYASDEEIITACKKANIHDLIMSLEKGYDSQIGGKNIGLSSGEAQRLGLARAFLRDANLILLDEPTGNVDCINEGIILKSIIENTKDKAVIIVSHRNSSLSIANRVYNMKNGKLYE